MDPPAGKPTKSGRNQKRPVLSPRSSNKIQDKEDDLTEKENDPSQIESTKTKEKKRVSIQQTKDARQRPIEIKVKEHDHLLQKIVGEIEEEKVFRTDLMKEIGSLKVVAVSNSQYLKNEMKTSELKLANKLDMSWKAILKEAEDCRFVETNAYKAVLNTLQGNNSVLITGLPGDGKTCLAYHSAMDFHIYQKMKPIILQHYEDWKNFISPDKNLFILMKDFCEQDVLSVSFRQNITHHLAGISSNISNKSFSTANKLILILRKEVLHAVWRFLRDLQLFSEDNIVDLSQEDIFYSLLSKEKLQMIESYEVKINLENTDKIFNAVPFGFPMFCHSNRNSADYIDAEVSENSYLHADIFENIESEFLLVLEVICLKGGAVRNVELLDIVQKWPYFFDIFKWNVHGTSELGQKLLYAANVLSDVYLRRSMQDYDIVFKFMHPCVNYIVASILMKKRPHLVFKLAPYDQFQLFQRAILIECLGISDVQIFKWILERILEDLSSILSTKVLEDISQLPEWQNDDFIDACITNPSFSHVVSNMNSTDKGHFVACATYAQRLKLVKLFFTVLRRKQFLDICRENDIIVKASEIGSTEIFEFLMNLGLITERDVSNLPDFLITAVRQNNVSFLSNVLKNYSTIAYRTDANGMNLLHHAAKSGSLEMLTFLIEKGFDLTVRSNEEETILHILVQYGSCDSVTWFSNKYPDQIKMKTKSGESVLHYAARNRNIDVLEYLLAHFKMNPYEETNSNIRKSLIHFACKCKNSKMVQYLLDNYPDMVDLQTTNSLQTVLQEACSGGDLETFKVICKHAKIKLKEENIPRFAYGNIFLHESKTVPKLFTKGKFEKQSLLHLAANCGSVGIVDYLVKNGCDVYQRSTDGQTALHIACCSGNFDVLRFLINKYPDLLNLFDNNGNDACLSVARSKSLESVKFLLNVGCFQGQTSRYGQGILHISCKESTVDIVRFLYEMFPHEYTKKDNEGMLPFHYSAMNSSEKVIQFCFGLTENVCATSQNHQTVLHFAYRNKNTAILKYVMDKLPVLIHRLDRRGYSALHFSCKYDNVNNFEFLLERGFNIDSKTYNNLTPFDVAFLNESSTIMTNIIKRIKFNSSKKITLNNTSPYKLDLPDSRSLKASEIVDVTLNSGREIGMEITLRLINAHFEMRKKSICTRWNIAEFGLFTELYLHANHEKHDSSFQKRLIEIGCCKSCVWLIDIAFLFPNKISDVWLTSFLKNISFCKSKNVLKAIAKGISRKFKEIFKDEIDIHSVWAGHDCSTCDRKEIADLDTLVVIVYQGNKIDSINITNYLGLKVYFRGINCFSREAREIMVKETEILSSMKLKERDVNNLLTNHSNITLISVSSFKSTGFGRQDSKQIHIKTIVLYCRVKGIIPAGEKEFPTFIGGYPVDVRESAVTLAVDKEGLRMGDKIGPSEGSNKGTLGGFVDLDNQKRAFITCAHVACPNFLGNKSVLDNIQEKHISISVIDAKGKQDVGIVQKVCFDPKSIGETSIDAALVELHDNFPETGQFTEKIKIEDYRKAGFKDREKLSFSTGEVAEISEHILSLVMKVGATTGITCGYIHFKDAEAIIDYKPHEVDFDGCKYFYHKQIEIKPHRCKQFITHGDSGAFVFSVEFAGHLLIRELVS